MHCFFLKWESASLFWIKEDISNGLSSSSSKQRKWENLRSTPSSLTNPTVTLPTHTHICANERTCLHAGTSHVCTQITIYAGHISYSKWIIWNILNIHNPWYYAINLCPESDTTTHHFTGAYQKQIIRGVGGIHMIYVLKQVPCVFHYN